MQMQSFLFLYVSENQRLRFFCYCIFESLLNAKVVKNHLNMIHQATEVCGSRVNYRHPFKGHLLSTDNHWRSTDNR